MKRVLLTGGSGFIGRQTIQPLTDAGYEVCLVLPEGVPAPESAICHRADLLDPVAVHRVMTAIKPSHLLHLAWYVEPGKFWTSIENVKWVHASLELFVQFAEAGGRRFVGAGTCAEYDWSGDGLCREFQTSLLPSTVYGACKNAVRQVIESMRHQIEVEFVWGRIFHLYGPFEPPGRLVSSLASALVEGRHATCTSGEQIRDFLHVVDVAGAFVSLVQADIEGPVNIASGSPVTIAEVARTAADCAGRPDLLQLGAIPSRNDEPKRLVADVSRLTAAGFRPRFSLRDGLRDTIQWWSTRTHQRADA